MSTPIKNTNFDVGIRKYVEYDQVKYWLNITAKSVLPKEEEEEYFNKLRLNHKGFRTQWKQFLESQYWKIFIICTMYINIVLFVTYFWIVQSSFVVSAIILMHLTCFFYWIDFLASAIKKDTKRISRTRKTMYLILDGVSLIPLSVAYCLLSKKINNALLWQLRIITLIRIYRLPRFLLEKSYAERNHWGMLIFSYSSILVLFMLAYANIFLYYVDRHSPVEVAHWNETLENQMVTSVYYVCEIVFNVAYGDISATSYDQIALSGLAMSVGAAVIMGIFPGILTMSFTNKTKHRESFRRDYEATMNTFKERKMEKKVMDKLRDNMLMLWNNTKGYTGTPDVKILPLSLQKEIFFDINYGFLNRSLMFQMRPRSFLRSVALLMKHATYLPGDIILEPFGTEEAMICVASGVIEVISEENDESPILSLTTGTILGETSLFISRPVPCFVRAATYVELQVLKKVDFSRLALKYPDIIRSMKEEILGRIQFTMRIKQREMRSNDADSSFREMERRKRTKVFLQTWKEFHKESVRDETSTDHKMEILELYVLSENIPRVKTLPIDILRAKPWILRPHTNFTKFWSIFMGLVIIFVAIAYPLWTAYSRKVTPDMYAILLTIKVIYFVDLYIECTTAVERKDHFTFDTNLKDIIRRKLQTFGFYLDILATYYLSIYADLVWPDQSQYAHLLLSLNSLLKIWRLIHYFGIIENDMRLNLLVVLTVKYVIVFTIMLVWMSVLLYLVACPTEYCHPERWFRQHQLTKGEKNSCNSAKVPAFSLSLYFACVTMFTVGLGDIVPTSVPDCWAASLCIILGITTIVTCTAEISSAFKHLARMRSAYQEDIFGVDRFMNEHDIPKSLQNDVRNFLRLQWDYDKGYALQKHFKMEKFPSLQKRILMFHLTMIFYSIPLFKNTNPEFVKLLAKLSRVRVLPPHTDILIAGSYLRGLYIVENGYCQVSSDGDDTSDFQKKIIGPINSFGVVEMILGTPLELSVHSLTHLRVISLSYKSYLKAITKFPGAKTQIDKILDEFKSNNKISELIRTFVNAQKEKTSITSTTNVLSKPFINVYKYKKGLKVSYWAPFEAWGKFQFLEVFVLPYVMTPECLFVKILMSVRIISALLLVVVAPIQFCFPKHMKGFMIFITTQQMIAAICLYLMLHVGYYDERGLLIYHPAKTAPRYLKGSFVLDLITIFPYALVKWFALPVHNAPPDLLIDGLGLILVLHLYKFIQGCQYLEQNILRKTDKIKILKYIPLAFLLVNSISGVMILLSCHKMSYIKDSQLPGDNRLSKEYRKALILLCTRGPNKNETLDDLSAFKLYVTTLYWLTSTITNTGFGDIVPYTESTMLAVVIIVLFGLFFLSFMYANISSNMISTSALIFKHRSHILRMIRFMKQNNVSPELQKRLTFHYEYNWQRTEGETPQTVFKTVNAVLRERLVASTYEDTIRQSKVFEKWEKVITRLISDNLKEIYFLRGEIIIRYNDILEHIYLIYRGKVSLMSKEGELVATMGCGGLFGNISNKPFALSSEIVIAEENVDVLILDCKVFFQFLQELPGARELVNNLTSLKQDYIVPKSEELNENSSIIPKINLYRIQPQGVKVWESEISRLGVLHLRKTIYVPKRKNFTSFIILPQTPLHNAITICVLALAYLSVCLTAYMFAFQDITVPLLTVTYILDGMFVLKIFLEFHTSYADRFGDCVITKEKIRKRYLTSWRILYDLGSIIPLDTIAFVNLSAPLLTGLRLNRVLRLYHIFEFYSLKCEQLMINKIYLQLAWILLMASLMIHICACVWFVAVCPLGYCHESTWVTEMNLSKRQKWELYFYSIYHILVITVSSGMHELQVYSIPEIILNVLFMFICRLCVVLLTSLFAAAIHAQRLSLFLFQERIIELKSFFTRQNITKFQMAKMWHYVTTLWLSDKGKQIPKFITTAPYAMKCEVMYEMFGNHLSQSYIFSQLEVTFLRQLAIHLRRFVYFPGNYIVQQGDIDETMYFIHKGQVSVLTIRHDLMETIHFTLVEKDHFGMKQGFVRGTPHAFSYRAETYVEIISLTLSHWQHLLKYFPRDEQTIIAAIEALPKKKGS